MALQIEISRPGGIAPGSGLVGPSKPPLLQNWESDEVAGDGERRSWADLSARSTRRRRLAVPVGAVEVQPAMLVMQLLLDAWRSADRQLAATVEGSPERSQVQAQVATLRSLYQGLFVRVRYAQTRADTGGW